MEISSRDGIFFILGSGASVDSGLPTYRGPSGMYVSCQLEFKNEPERILSPLTFAEPGGPKLFWDFKRSFYQQIQQCKPGPTYEKILDIAKKFPRSFVLTQNVDGYAKILNVPVIEIHGNWSTVRCIICQTHKNTLDVITNDQIKCSCGGWYRPNVVLFGENLPKDEVRYTYQLIKSRPKYVVIVGTTLQFPYLRIFIAKCKSKGAKVIHINPDDDYISNVRNNEKWIRKSAKDGLQDLIDEWNSHKG